MATQGQVQRYKLTGNETISVNKMGSNPVLTIGQYQFELPTSQTELNKFASQWHQASNQFENLSSVGGVTGGISKG